ncbi:hypothetical protein JTE90_029262 [Oedothorax gibbosus]|uniref:Uncharacterized protein n=1 Tax=Oedothorax gibbosus TaxID=931172 RepID=A0AAV6TUU8_9ARAC|nr:hypothetical protein JTE90_029262 [Oedothorax gibbosus]
MCWLESVTTWYGVEDVLAGATDILVQQPFGMVGSERDFTAGTRCEGRREMVVRLCYTVMVKIEDRTVISTPITH